MADNSTQYVLRFVYGKYQGGEFPLHAEREILVGRSADVDMVLVEDMVSRRHAKITTLGGQLFIQDLGSTNGTFVNGEKIKRMRLKEGDRILIGTSILKLVPVDQASESAQLSEGEARSRMADVAARSAGNSTDVIKADRGRLEEIPVLDLLQLLSTSKRSGVLLLMGGTSQGQIYLKTGQVRYASIDEAFDLTPRKALDRMLSWSRGYYQLEPPDDREFLEAIEEPTEALLTLLVHEHEEARELLSQLPPRDVPLTLPLPLHAPLRDLTPLQLDILQLVLNNISIGRVLEKSPLSDLDTLRGVQFLLVGEYLITRENTGSKA